MQRLTSIFIVFFQTAFLKNVVYFLLIKLVTVGIELGTVLPSDISEKQQVILIG